MAAVSEHSDGVITKTLLKMRSGEFDLESIHTLSLKETGISDLGCLSECIALERVDLSFNDITRLHKLAGLNLLKTLNLSANRITSLDGLQSLENLQNLNLAGNLLGSIDCLRTICSLTRLTHLRLKDDTTGLSNPMCNTDYTNDVLHMLPSINTFNGQRVRGEGSELFEQYNHLDNKINSLSPLLSRNVNDGDNINTTITMTTWVVDDKQDDKVIEAENQFKALLSSCKKLYDNAFQQFDKDWDKAEAMEGTLNNDFNDKFL